MLNSVPGDRTRPYRIRLVRRRLISLSETFPRFRNSSARGMGSIRNVLGARFSLHRLGPRGRTNIYCCCFFLCWIITRTHSLHCYVFVWVFFFVFFFSFSAAAVHLVFDRFVRYHCHFLCKLDTTEDEMHSLFLLLL